MEINRGWEKDHRIVRQFFYRSFYIFSKLFASQPLGFYFEHHSLLLKKIMKLSIKMVFEHILSFWSIVWWLLQCRSFCRKDSTAVLSHYHRQLHIPVNRTATFHNGLKYFLKEHSLTLSNKTDRANPWGMRPLVLRTSQMCCFELGPTFLKLVDFWGL